MVCLAQEVRQGEAQVEGRVAEVDHLMIEQHQPPLIHQHVLRTVVAMHKRVAPGTGPVDQTGIKGGDIGNLRGGVGVIRLEPQRFKERAIGEGRLDLGAARGGGAVNRPEQTAELLDVIDLQPAGEQ